MKTKKRFTIINPDGLKIRGAVWNYRATDTVVLFVHGFGGFMREPQYVALRRKLVERDFVVCTFDQTNSLGVSGKNPAVMSYDGYYEDVAQVVNMLREAGVRYIHLVAHSLGGGIAIQRIVEGFGGVSFLSATLINPLITARGTMIIKDVPDDWKNNGQLQLRRFLKKLTITRAALESMQKFDISHLASRVTTPLFFVLGVHDSTIPNEQSVKFAREMRVESLVRQYPFLGHTFFHPNALAHMDRIVYDIIEWIEQHDIQR